MKNIKLNSYAKINLALSIEHKRKDGYHEIKSIMQTISLHDIIKLKKNTKIICKINIKNIPTDEKNLAVKAAKTFFNYTKIKGGVKISIKKHIPTKAGLGGGSSNAAFVLLGLNNLYETKLEKQILLKLAEKIGADVPFLVCGGTSYVKGIGENVKQIKPITNFYIVLVKPNFEIKTKEAYSKYDKFYSKNKTLKKDSITNLIMSIYSEKKIEKISNFFFNDFEKILNFKIIDKIKNKMKKLKALSCNVTGSGSCLFATFQNLKTAKKAAKYFKKEKLKTFICHPIKKYF